MKKGIYIYFLVSGWLIIKCTADVLAGKDEYYQAPHSTYSIDTTPEDPNRCTDNVPSRCDPTYPYRTFDGTCNNLDHPRWGSANECYLRFQKAFYEGYGEVRKSMRGNSLPEPRQLTLNIFTDAHRPTPKTSFMLTIFGQGVAHDLGDVVLLNANVDCCASGSENNPACLPILFRPNDPDFSRYNVTCIQFHTSKNCNLCNTANREQISDVTSVLDASIVYDCSNERSNNMRAYDGTGKLISNQTNEGELLPNGKDPGDGFCPKAQESMCFLAGDRRVNQHATLTSLQTLLLREHNRLATSLKQMNPHWDEERLFQEARRINIAQLQCITYKEYLPYVLGPNLMEQFNLNIRDGPDGTLYNPNTRPGIVNEFSTAAFRLHSMVASKVGALGLHFEDLYLNPKLIWEGHMDKLMKGVCQVPSEKFDHWYTKGVTVELTKQPDSSYGSDLSSTDIQRGRDAGLAPYIYLVRFCSENQIKIMTFDDLSSMMSAENIELLKQNYDSVEDVDLWVGLHMEYHLPGAEVGPTTACIIAKQFYLIKFGDRFYFEHIGQVPSFTPVQRNTLKQCSFSRLLCDNTNITQTQKNVMLLPSAENPEVSCNEIPKIDLSLWKDWESS
ncbi:peroxidase [Nephila pilipes]|uniref:Peroxidase n=1 Tax=Nephila pilipes TaxID=299642 RepID=A0A8X6N9N8_NEPPI|nr:peroxidase [Nephila pilipes]